jgi:dsDNA-binding SOS-regulon protein
MSNTELKQVFVTPDGVQHDSKAAANDHLRGPKVLAALMVVTDNNQELSDWLLGNQDTVNDAFETGTIKRVTKSEHNKLVKAVDAIVESGDKAFAFVVENAQAVKDSFRWPSVKRMTDEEKASQALLTLKAASDNNEDLSNWVIGNKDAILEAFNAGKVKRVVSPKAAEALAAYRARKAAEKASATPAPAI